MDLFPSPVQRTLNGNLRDAKWFSALYASGFYRNQIFSAVIIRIMEIDIKFIEVVRKTKMYLNAIINTEQLFYEFQHLFCIR